MVARGVPVFQQEGAQFVCAGVGLAPTVGDRPRTSQHRPPCPPERPARTARQKSGAVRQRCRDQTAEGEMFRRKSGDQEEEGRSLDGGEERRAPSVVVESTRRGVPNKTVVFHPDVPRGAPPDPMPADAPGRVESDPKRLTVGRETTISGGTVLDCERLTVEGTVEASMPDGRLLEIVKGGTFKGTVTVDNADIAGSFEGRAQGEEAALHQGVGPCFRDHPLRPTRDRAGRAHRREVRVRSGGSGSRFAAGRAAPCRRSASGVAGRLNRPPQPLRHQLARFRFLSSAP